MKGDLPVDEGVAVLDLLDEVHEVVDCDISSHLESIFIILNGVLVFSVEVLVCVVESFSLKTH